MPEWVSGGSVRKYHRALATLARENANRKAQGQPEVEVTEEALKALYVKDGGLVLGDPSSVRGTSTDGEQPSNGSVAISADVAEARATETQGKKPRVKKAKE